MLFVMSNLTPKADPERILPVLIHIQTHLDADLSLEQMAALAALSPYHFHRLFRATVGETLKQYSQRLRLERAAFDLKICQSAILDVALNAGYRSHETFSRAFRRQFGMTPLSYRQAVGRLLQPQAIGQNRQPLNQLTQAFSLSGVRVQRLAPLPLAFRRHLGSYEAVDVALFAELVDWARRHGYYTGDNLLLGIGHDDPSITPLEKVRFDACIQVPGPFAATGAVGFQTLPTGRYATITYIGPYGPIMAAAYEEIYRQISQLHSYRLLGLPAIEIYRTVQINPSYELNETDIYLPVEPIQ